MGKNFKNELDALDLVYRSAMEKNIDIIADFIKNNRHRHVYGVGSGGSYSVAAAFEYLCIRSGMTAQRLTPLELGGLHFQLGNSSSVLFTAGGSNNDSKNAYRYISEHEPEAILTCCMKENAPIKRIQRENGHNYYFEYRMPVSKDGYLAVESTVSSIVLMIRAFWSATLDDFFSLSSGKDWEDYSLDIDKLRLVTERETIIVLYDGISTPAAIDFESKFSEASLGNIQLVDYRNFAHGRHYWLSNRRERTSIIAFIGASRKKLADRTLRVIPDDIPVLRIDINDDSAEGIIDALNYCFRIVWNTASFRGVDPGKPNIESFGRKLYHINYDIGDDAFIKNRKKNMFFMAAYRKTKNYLGLEFKEYIHGARLFWERLSERIFRGIVFDYDGTIHDQSNSSNLELRIFDTINSLLSVGVVIGIATGRGKSVRVELREKINRSFWGDVYIAYYNGCVIGTLEDDQKPNKIGIRIPKAFERVIDLIPSKSIEENPYQITIFKDDSGMNSSEITEIKNKVLGVKGIRIVESDHSIDINLDNTGKKDILKSIPYKEEDYLFIGDSGNLGGNDYELLSGETGLSVDCVSDSRERCWNYAMPGLRNLEATEYYLNMIEILDGGLFRLKG